MSVWRRASGYTGRRHGGRAGDDIDLQLFGAGNFSNSDQFYSADNASLRGSGDCWGAAVFTYDSAFSGPSAICGAGAANGSGCWLLWGTTGTVYIRLTDGGGAKSHFAAPGPLAHVHAILFTHTGSSLQLWYNNVEIASPTATDGTCPNKAGNPFCIGSRKNSGAYSYGFDNGRIVGCCGGDASGVPTDAEITTWFSAVKAAADIVEIPSKTEHLYSVKRDWQNEDATWEDNSGAADLTKRGSPDHALIIEPWAY